MRKVLPVVIAAGLFFAACGGPVEPPPDSPPPMEFSVKLDNQAQGAFTLLGSQAEKAEGQILVRVVLEPKKSISDQQVKFTGKTADGKEVTATLAGPVSAGEPVEVTFRVEEGAKALTLTGIGR